MVPVRSRFVSLLLLCGLLLTATSSVSAASLQQVARGRALYLRYCASCHGVNAEGNGPLAPSLTTPPANLRRLSERYGNPLPEDQIARDIDGRAAVKAHGPRDMPVWGTRFYYKSRGDERRAQQWIADLVAYLQSIQEPVGHASLY